MMDAEVGDDVWGDDPTVNELQVRVRVWDTGRVTAGG